MNDFRSKAIVFIYKRSKVKDDDGYISYTYEFVETSEGFEVKYDNDDLVFKDKKGKKYEFIENINYLDEDYVYAFPTYLDNLSDDDEKKYIDSVNSEKNIASYYALFQTYEIKSNKLLTYSMNPETRNTVNIETSSHNGINTLCSYKSQALVEVKNTTNTEESKNKLIVPTPIVVYSNEMYEHIAKTVIYQDDQIKSISATISKNLRIDIPNLKDNLLVCGPTGVGKSEIFRCVSHLIDVPIIMEDSTEFTAQGYKGKDVTSMLYNLYLTANGDMDKTQRGIIIIDEIDKKISEISDHEIYSKAVLDSLLKMIEGHKYKVEIPRHGIIDIDTSFITFVMAGAFSGIEKFNEERRSLGFVSQEDKINQESTKKSYTDKTLLKYGLKPEILGRSKLVVLDSLDFDKLKGIMINSDKSQLLLYKYMLENMGINFIYEEDTIDAIAKKAVELGVGARSIKKIVEKAFELINYELFSRNNYKELIISPETIEDNKKFILR